jgi:hypothetical protein
MQAHPNSIGVREGLGDYPYDELLCKRFEGSLKLSVSFCREDLFLVLWAVCVFVLCGGSPPVSPIPRVLFSLFVCSPFAPLYLPCFVFRDIKLRVAPLPLGTSFQALTRGLGYQEHILYLNKRSFQESWLLSSSCRIFLCVWIKGRSLQ